MVHLYSGVLDGFLLSCMRSLLSWDSALALAERVGRSQRMPEVAVCNMHVFIACIFHPMGIDPSTIVY